MNHSRRKFRPRQQKNNFRRRGSNSGPNNSLGNNNYFSRNGSSKNPFTIEKTIQKYQQLAKDALSSGDPVLSENYFQHVEHFNRKLKDLNAASGSKESVLSKNKETKDNSVTKINNSNTKVENS
tara:strand:- start:219 stop:590 length:372 start_codon:yes stop_codon:yes gene_type:complete